MQQRTVLFLLSSLLLLLVLAAGRHRLGSSSSASPAPAPPPPPTCPPKNVSVCCASAAWRRLLPNASYVLLLGDSHLRATWSGLGAVLYGQAWKVNLPQYHQPHLTCCDDGGRCVQEVRGQHFNGSAPDQARLRLRKGAAHCYLWVNTPLPIPNLLEPYYASPPYPNVAIFNYGLHMLFRNWTRSAMRATVNATLAQDKVLRVFRTKLIYHTVSWPEPRKWKYAPPPALFPKVFAQYEQLAADQREFIGKHRTEWLDATSFTRYSPLLVNTTTDGIHYPAIYGNSVAAADLRLWLCPSGERDPPGVI